MAKVRQTVVTKKTKKRTKKTGSGYKKCPKCGGSGRVKK